ncbi:MAG TPA: MFS transporter [Mycobacteriales bacterium]|nr:MFS transporter [Mycobacteriales bacterium]
MTRRRSVLRQRDVAILVASTAISVTGDTAAVVALLLRLHAHGGSGWAIAALLLAGSAPMIVLSPLAGALVDRVDSRTAIATSALAQAACAAALAHVTGTVATLALVALLSACGTVVNPAVGALLPRTVPEDRLVEAGAHQQTAFVLGNLAGPATGGLLSGMFGSSAPLELDAASFLVVALGIFLVRTRRRVVSSAETTRVRRSGVRILWDDPVLRTVVSTMAALILACGAVNVAEVFLMKDALHTSDVVFGIVGASWMAGMIVGSAATPRLGRTTSMLLRVMAVAQLLTAAALVATGVSPVWPLAALAFMVGGVGNGALTVACRTIVTFRVPDEFRGRAFGVMSGAVNAASVSAYAAGGALVAGFGPRMTIVGCGCAALGVGLAFALHLRSAAQRPAAPAVPAAELSTAR